MATSIFTFNQDVKSEVGKTSWRGLEREKLWINWSKCTLANSYFLRNDLDFVNSTKIRLEKIAGGGWKHEGQHVLDNFVSLSSEISTSGRTRQSWRDIQVMFGINWLETEQVTSPACRHSLIALYYSYADEHVARGVIFIRATLSVWLFDRSEALLRAIHGNTLQGKKRRSRVRP